MTIGKLLKTTLRKTIGVSPLAVWLAFLPVQSSFAAPGDGESTSEPARASEPIPWSEIGTKATAQYAGDGLSISAAGLSGRTLDEVLTASRSVLAQLSPGN